MTTYYDLLPDNTIARATPFPDIAESLGMSLKTEQEIVYGYDGKLYFKGKEPTPSDLTYIEKRMASYPPIAEQLDMIYWDKINGTNCWIDLIKDIKAKYPKQ